MKVLTQYQKDFKNASDVLFRLLHNTAYDKVARPVNGLSYALSIATTFNKIQLNYIELLEKLSYLKGALQDDSKILRHLHRTINMLKSLYTVAQKELVGNPEEAFLVVQAEQEEGGVRLKAYQSNEYVKAKGAISIHVKGDWGLIQHLPDNDWTLTDLTVL